MIFGHEAPECGAEGTVLEHFRNFSENLFLRNEIKSENSRINFLMFPEKLVS